jgi:hypothetical protein
MEIVSKHYGSIIQPYTVIKGDSLKPHIKSIVTNDLQRLSVPILFDSEYCLRGHRPDLYRDNIVKITKSRKII